MILSLLRAARILVGLLAILCMTLVRVRAATTVHDPPHAEPAPSHAPSRPESVPVPIGNESTNVAPVSLPGSDAPAAGEGSEDGEGAPVPGFEVEINTWLEAARHDRAATNYAAAESLLLGIMRRQLKPELYRPVLRELAVLYETKDDLARAQQVLSQYLVKYPADPAVPDVLLEQGRNYQRMGLPRMAVSKYYVVMSTAINLASGDPSAAQRTVLRAQHEIANSYFDAGDYSSAVDFFRRMLKLKLSSRDEAMVRYKLVRSLERLSRTNEVVGEAEQFVTRCPTATQLPEVRVLLADSLKKAGRDSDALVQVAALLQQDRTQPGLDLEALARWQWRAGNDLGNQLYRQGDYVHSLEVYRLLESLGTTPEWRWSIWYQTALVLEKLDQTQRARETYKRILAERSKSPAGGEAGLDLVADLARWRLESLDWGDHAAAAFRDLGRSPAATPAPAPVKK